MMTQSTTRQTIATSLKTLTTVLRTYLAIKILTANATRGHQEGKVQELEMLSAIRDLGDDRDYLPLLFDHFEEEGPHGSHLCLRMTIMSTDVTSLRRSSPNQALPIFTARILLAEIVEALVQLHDLNIIHTDLKLDNVLFVGAAQARHLERLLERSGSPLLEGEVELDGHKYPIMRSQPLPHGCRWDADPSEVELFTVFLTDFSHAQWANRAPTVEEISPYALRAPEVILRAGFDAKVDIWALGCLTFELLTGRWLFNPEGGEGGRREDDHLAKMMEITGETFSASLLERSRLRSEYFHETGQLLRLGELFPVSLEAAIANYKVLPEEEIVPAAAFIRACLHLDPADRASAKQLQMHRWLRTAFAPCRYGCHPH